MHDSQFPLPPENSSFTQAFRANFLSEFATRAAHLPPNELRKAKLLYLENAIADYQTSVENNYLYSRIIVGAIIALIITILIDTFFFMLPIIFLIMSTFWRTVAKTGQKRDRRKIINAIEIWKDDLGDEYYRLL